MKKRILPVCLAVVLACASGCASRPDGGSASQQPAPSASSSAAPPAFRPAGAGTSTDYFPIRENVRYVYRGEGNEYASYDMTVDYTDDTHIQQRINNGGTETVRVLELENGEALCVFSRGEIYYRENFLGRAADTREVLLKDPIETGTSWKLEDGSVRTITGVSVQVDTPSGTYSAVSVETANASGKTVDYYVRHIGLVQTVAAGKDYEISSSLSEIREDVSFVQTVRFYYPDGNGGKLYYKDRAIPFRTNDITRKALEAAYKEPVSGQPGNVFSDNTRINSLYLNRDGMVYLDLSREFLTEMNAGSGYESMILQCAANTFGSYYGAEKVILTIDGGLYESGHIKLGKGEYLSVRTDGSLAIA